jgi:hypothetical protein
MLVGAASGKVLIVLPAVTPVSGVLKAVPAAVSVQSVASHAVPQSYHSPWKLRASVSTLEVTAALNAALVIIASSGNASVFHCTNATLLKYVPFGLRLRDAPSRVAAGKH